MDEPQPDASYLPRRLPQRLAGLAELAVDVRWNWNHTADALWERVDPDLWNATGNAWLILQSVSERRLETLAQDETFVAELDRVLTARDEFVRETSWFSTNHPDARIGTVAYFSMEFGLGEALPIYSGGLGILAGDHLKTASDLGVPLVGVGLLYQRGYFRQALSANGEQLAFYPFNDPTLIPTVPLRDRYGEWLRVEIELPGRTLHLRSWQVQVGNHALLLLDSNHPLNLPRDRGITGELYGGNVETRLEQEIVLGIGGWRLLEAIGAKPSVCHLNEGHAAFVILERARCAMRETGMSFHQALRCTKAGNVFTTHTPVAAAFDRFPKKLIGQYFEAYTSGLGINLDELLALGRINRRDDREPFNMAYLALRGSNRANGVSRLHGEVSREIFAPLFPDWPLHEVPVSHITNGAHMPSWDSAAADALWTRTSGKERWLGSLRTLERDFRKVDDDVLWDFCSTERAELIRNLRRRLMRQQSARGEKRGTSEHRVRSLDPNALTLGFARRFAEYKRPDLLLYDPERLIRIITDPKRPVQLVVAGKAHPQDEVGCEMVRKWTAFMNRPEVRGRVVFVEDYDIGLAAELVQGIDVWINNPRRPWEASGTSGMKVLVNGGLNLSVLDGWWAEAYESDVGWALGDGRNHSSPQDDWRDARAMYDLLESEVIPAFYDRDERGIPLGWTARVRESMARLTPRFSANRMVREYTQCCYLPAARDLHARMESEGELGRELEDWWERCKEHWQWVHFGRIDSTPEEEGFTIEAQVYLGELSPQDIAVEVYADPGEAGDQSVWSMERGSPLSGALNGFAYVARVPGGRPADHYTPRIRAAHPAARVPIENNLILWAG